MNNLSSATCEDNAPFNRRALKILKTLSHELTPIERTILKSRLSGKIPYFFDANNHLRVADGDDFVRFNLLAEALRTINIDFESIPANGIAYRGTPEWVTAELITQLREEAIKRRHEPLDRTDHFLGCGGAIADLLSTDPTVLKFVTQNVGPVLPTGIASYLYYDRPGLGIKPHVDTDVFSVNLMLMVRHDCAEGTSPSATVVFPAWHHPESHRLSVGEVMLMHGGSVVHTRSIISPEEVVHLLTIGFKRTSESVKK